MEPEGSGNYWLYLLLDLNLICKAKKKKVYFQLFYTIPCFLLSVAIKLGINYANRIYAWNSL